MNNKRKNRGPVRTQRTRSVLAEGVYNNAHFMHSATLQIGNVVRIKTASGVVWEGVFKTFSSNFDVVLEVAAKVDNPNTPNQTLIAESLVDKLIFKSVDISTMEARDVDLEYPTKDTFQTDTAISARLNGNSNKSLEEKELEPWDASTGVNGGGENVTLELENANGWDANDMFKKNEQEYGVTSTFDQSLKGYTVPLKTNDTADYREAEAKAAQIANEIENQPQHKARLELENGDEETAFAAVVRPSQEQNDKYIPPAKRKNQNAGKLVRSTPPPPPQQQGAPPTTPSPKGVPPAGAFPVQQAPPPAQAPPPPFQQPMRQQHGYGPGRGQGQKSGQQINGDVKPSPMQPRRNYQSYQPTQQDPKPDVPPHQPRHHPREDPALKDLHGFAQDFKMPPPAAEVAPPPEQAPPPKQTTPPRSPPQDVVDKVTNTLKNSTLNPNAKEFVLNPAAKPFQPRSPSTPSASRPHTPQTPSHSPYIPATVSGPVGQPHMSVVMPLSYMMPSQPQYQPQPQGTRMRKIQVGQMRTDVASQMQVAAATGQPLLAPPLQQFVYPPGINSPASYPQMHALRMYDAPPQIQYLPPPPPSNAPSPAQPPPPYGQSQPSGPQPPPPQQYQPAPPPPQSHPQIPPIMCSIFQPHMMQNVQYHLQQPPPPQPHHIPVMLPPHQQQHPAP